MKTRAEAAPRCPRPILVLAYGNPSRGDDALGPLLIERLRHRQRAGELQGLELLTDFQLQIEHILDLQGRDLVIFADAGVCGPEPYGFTRVPVEPCSGYSTHAMSPGALLHLYGQTLGEEPPPAWLLAMRGYAFALGSPPTPEAQSNLRAAVDQLVAIIRNGVS